MYVLVLGYANNQVYVNQTHHAFGSPKTNSRTCMKPTWKRSCTRPVQFPPSMNVQGTIRRCSWMPWPCSSGDNQGLVGRLGSVGCISST